VVLALTRLRQMFLRRARPGLADLAWAVPGSLSLVDRIFATDRAIPSKHLAWLAAVVVAALLVVACHRVLFE
jgi:hypothetical protein